MAGAVLCRVWWFCSLPLLFAYLPVSAVSSDCTAEIPPLVADKLCGDNLCWCHKVSAYCSQYGNSAWHMGNLSYIPRLPDTITSVDLSCNNLSSSFFIMTRFANITNMTDVDLSNNRISWISRNMFAEMKKLTSLNLDHNEALTFSSLREILSIESLTHVSVRNCGLGPPPADLFHNDTSGIGTILFDSNPHYGMYSLEGFCPLQSLTQLSLQGCEFKDIVSSCSLPGLDMLHLGYNALRTFPESCMGGESIFPRLEYLDLQHNCIEEVSTTQICLPSLRKLDMSFNFISVYPTGAFSSMNFPLLYMLNLQHQSRSRSLSSRIIWFTGAVEAYAFDNPNLKFLNIASNRLYFGKEWSVNSLAFANCSSIRTLYLDSNNFMHVDENRFLLLFGHMQSLDLLSMRNNKFASISRKTFAKFPRLTRLFLYENIIDNIPDGAFDSLENLLELKLDRNQIKTVNENTFGLNLLRNLSSLTLASNPFMCSCDLLWFQRWFQTEQSRLFKDTKTGNYKCHNIPGMALANFSMTDQACLLSQEANILILQSCGIAIFCLTLVSLVFRYRWHIRLLMYEMFRGRDVLRRQRLQENNFEFDVFVSFASEDLSWVRQQLMANLEEGMGLRLCVHERDFVPGRHIVDNIVQCVESSKKILMVFSKDFVRSPWCQFELSLCLSHVMDYDDALVVVCVDDVTSRQMTSAMMGVLKTTTYIQWRVEEEAVASFWGRLHLALHEIIPHNEQYV